jgi:hypothetical protein
VVPLQAPEDAGADDPVEDGIRTGARDADDVGDRLAVEDGKPALPEEAVLLEDARSITLLLYDLQGSRRGAVTEKDSLIEEARDRKTIFWD